MRKSIVLFAVILLFACKREKEIIINSSSENNYSFKSSWIIGEWVLTKGCQLAEYNGDTVFTVYDSTKRVIYNPSYSRYELFKVKLVFEAYGSYRYEEINEYSPGSINSTWKWLNSSENKTHLFFPIAFNSNFQDSLSILPTAFRLIKLSETQLIIEDMRGYFHFEYRRISPIIDEGNFENVNSVSPKSILGSWKLARFYEPYNNGTAQWYMNDTLYQQVIDHGIQTSKVTYSLIVNILEHGDFTANQIRSNVPAKTYDYWYWTDDTEPHEILKFPSVIQVTYGNYEIKKLDQDSLTIQNGNTIISFKRIN